MVEKPRRGRPRSTSLKGKRKAADADEDEYVEKRSPAKAPVLEKVERVTRRRQLPLPVDTDTEEEELPKTSVKTSVKKASQASLADKAEDKNSVDEFTSSPKPPHTPRRRASVVLPTLAEVRSASQQAIGADEVKSKKPVSAKQKKRTEKEEAAPEVVSPKRGRPPGTRAIKRTPQKAASPRRTPSSSPARAPKPKAGRRSTGGAAHESGAGPSRVEEPVVNRRRSAATKAAQKLHDELMPDLMSFQKELKNGHVRSKHEEELAARGKGKDGAKGKKRAVAEDVESEDEEHDRKRRKTETGTKKKGRKSDTPVQEEEEEEEPEIVEVPKKRGRPAKSKPANEAT